MSPTLSGVLAMAGYLMTATLCGRALWRGGTARVHPGLVALGGVSLLCHTVSVYGLIQTPEGLNLGFFHVSSLIFAFIVLIGLVSARLPIGSLLVVLYPLASLGILVSLIFPGHYAPRSDFTVGTLAHILIAVLAYSVITIATLQAVALALQEYLLKHGHLTGLLNVWPPLQVMETLLFRMIAIGFTLLSLTIVTGVAFMEDLFAQHLAHKTFFTLVAWGVFAVLLWGRHQRGWRSKTALRWTLSGFVALMLAFFGSKFVLELLLR